MMLDRIVEVFCEVDDFCQAFLPHWEASLLGAGGTAPRGPEPGLSPSEEGVPGERRILHNGEASLKHLIGHAAIPLLPPLSQYPCCEIGSPSRPAEMAVPALPVSVHKSGSAR